MSDEIDIRISLLGEIIKEITDEDVECRYMGDKIIGIQMSELLFVIWELDKSILKLEKLNDFNMGFCDKSNKNDKSMTFSLFDKGFIEKIKDFIYNMDMVV